MGKRTKYMMIAAMCLLCACAKDDTDHDKQVTSIKEYFDKTLRVEPEIIEGVYRYIYKAEIGYGQVRGPLSEEGDEVVFDYSAYQFSGNNTVKVPFDTTYEYIARDTMKVTTQGRVFEPKRITLGNGDVMRGLEVALKDCMKGDMVIVAIPSALAFGDKEFATLPKGVAVSYRVAINDVIKQDSDL